MSQVDRSDIPDHKRIVNDNKTNYYDKMFGKGKNRKDNMAYALVRGFALGSIAFMALATIANVILVNTHGIKFYMAEPIRVFVTAMMSFLMMVLGYLFRGATDK